MHANESITYKDANPRLHYKFQLLNGSYLLHIREKEFSLLHEQEDLVNSIAGWLLTGLPNFHWQHGQGTVIVWSMLQWLDVRLRCRRE